MRPGWSTQVRKSKSAAEIEYIREAGRLTVLGVEAAMVEIGPGKTDNDLSAACHEVMIRAGSEYFTKWQNIMTGYTVGVSSLFPRPAPDSAGDVIYMELGASYRRYDALMMRTATFGEPDDLTKRMADAMLRTFDVLTSNIKPGRTAHDVAMEAKKAVGPVTEEAFFIENFGYSVGIGVPSIWGEDLIFIAEGVDEPLQPGMVFHTPLTIHVPGQRGWGSARRCWLRRLVGSRLRRRSVSLRVVPVCNVPAFQKGADVEGHRAPQEEL